MATALQPPSTPPPHSTLNTPRTPRHGAFEDDYQPYSPRKSSRISQRARDTNTPPPRQTSSSMRNKSTPQTSRIASTSNAFANTPASPPMTSKRRTPRQLGHFEGGSRSGALDIESTSSAATVLGLPTPSRTDKMDVSRSALRNNGMLPTPAKTPQRASATNLAVKGVARNIFPTRGGTDDEIMPTPRKKSNKKYSGFTINSFGVDEEDSPIAIFTDSHDRVPSPDISEDNPFYSQHNNVPAEPVRRTSKRRKVSVKGEEDQEMTDIGSRKDGLVYIFRGKRVFRRFSDAVDVDEDVSNTAPIGESSETEIDVNDLPNHQGPLTRSSVVPRLLFATEEQKKEKEARLKAAEEEEADTDIELPIMASSSSRRRTGNRTDALMESTPSEQVDCDITTPKAPRFAPYSPPTTGRATRSQKLELSDPPTESDDDRPTTPTHKLTASKRVSPFMGWQRTKGEAATSTKKRQATSLPQSSTGKKARRV